MGHYILRSTLGDPMADFTYLLMQWTMPGLAGNDLKALNIPSMEEAAHACLFQLAN